VTRPAFRVGVISDTHSLLRPEAVEALRGSELILHAGDIGAPEILDELSQLAPVVAVRGNNDLATWASAIPLTQVVTVRSRVILVVHEIAHYRASPPAVRPQVVVCGHSHQPGFFEEDGVLFFNPGSAGPRRFKLPIAVGELRIGSDGVAPSIRELVLGA